MTFASFKPDLTGTAQAARFQLRRLGTFAGAEITRIDLSQPLDAPTVEALKQAHATYGVLTFPDQKISSDDLKRFGRYFGELSVHPFSTNALDSPELIIYDNKEGNPPAPTDIWHADDTFRGSTHGHGALFQDHPRIWRGYRFHQHERGVRGLVRPLAAFCQWAGSSA